MTFLSMMFVSALPLVAAPIVIHLLFRRQKKVIRWGAMQFLLDAQRRRRRISRIDDWFLMLLRCAALLFLVLALARPMVRAAWVGKAPHRDVILVLDVSLTMGRDSGPTTPFERLHRKLTEIAKHLTSTDAVHIVLAASTPQWQTTEPLAGDSAAFGQLCQRVQRMSPSLGPADLMGTIEQALAVETGRQSRSRIVTVVTDCRQHGWPADCRIAAARLQQQIAGSRFPTVINVVDVGESADRAINIGLEGLETDRVLAGIGETIEFRARLKNYGAIRVESCSLQWSCDGDSFNVSFAEALDPGQTTTVQIQHAFDQSGEYAVNCHVDYRDELLSDNDAKVILEIRDKVPVLIVGPSERSDPVWDESQYVLAALGNRQQAGNSSQDSRFFEAKLVDITEFQSTALSGYAVIVFTVTPPFTDALAERVTQFVASGGGLWLALGMDSDADAFNQHFAASEEGLSPVLVGAVLGKDDHEETFVTVHPPAVTHPATGLLGDTVRLDIRDAKIFRRYELKANSATKPSILLETGDGQILAVERFHGAGRVIIQAFPLTRSWSNMTLCKLFVPYVQEWLRYLSQPSAVFRNLSMNSPLVLKQGLLKQGRDATEGKALLKAPYQEPLSIMPDVEAEELIYRYFGTAFPGDYSINLGGDTNRVARFYVNRDPDESDLTELTATQRTELTSVPNLHFVTNPLEWPSTVTTSSAQAPVWSWFLLGLILLILTELFSVCWFAWRKHLIAQFPAAVASS
ncbi:BatA domain-containing protein [Schlesneria paludicola]|uniref:BatA domain-containing protein n=1 Tax=Schlesneria paludicola TaxID=360056 RepID=UPI0002E3D137|nr:BatA domain-containing protein [Schlesneria paludicola]